MAAARPEVAVHSLVDGTVEVDCPAVADVVVGFPWLGRQVASDY